MPCRGRKPAKSASTPPLLTPAKGLLGQSADETSSVDYTALKRAELQLQCKKLGLRAIGKNAELVDRLKDYHGDPQRKTAVDCGAKEEASKNEECRRKTKALREIPYLGVTKDVKTEPSKEKTDIIQGWCVVHGMVLYRPPSSWVPLLLRGGLVCIQDGKDLVPFRLPPLNISVPEGMSDNYVCIECVIRNRENLSPVQNSVSRPSLLATGVSKDRRRTTDIRKLYQPQEDQAYAQRVDGILSQMARGEVGMDRALRPLQPLVFHSPASFYR